MILEAVTAAFYGNSAVLARSVPLLQELLSGAQRFAHCWQTTYCCCRCCPLLSNELRGKNGKGVVRGTGKEPAGENMGGMGGGEGNKGAHDAPVRLIGASQQYNSIILGSFLIQLHGSSRLQSHRPTPTQKEWDFHHDHAAASLLAVLGHTLNTYGDFANDPWVHPP